MHWSACAYAHADKCIYFKQVHMLTRVAYHFNSSVQRVIDQWPVSRALCNFGRIKRGVRGDIKYTWTNLKIVRLGIARTHGWVELAPMVPMSSSHRSSTVLTNLFRYLFASFAFISSKYIILCFGPIILPTVHLAASWVLLPVRVAVIIMEWINWAVFDIQRSCGLNISNFDIRTTSCPYTKR